MIEVRELRIGNYINDGNANVPIADISYLTEEICNNIFPILLTEKLFENSFVINVDLFPEKFRIDYLFKNICLCVGDYKKFYKIENIKYVHQLQNLYFALTGIEIEIHL